MVKLFGAAISVVASGLAKFRLKCRSAQNLTLTRVAILTKNFSKQSAFLKQNDDHKFDLTAQPLKIRATLASTFCIDNDVSIGACAVTTDSDLLRRVVMLLRNDIFDCSRYYFHLQHAHERRDGAKYSFGCPVSVEHRPAERDPSTIRRYIVQKEYFQCHDEFHISFSKTNASATVIYEHIGHTESRKFHMIDDVRNYMKSHKYHPPRQIYRNLIQMTNVSDFEKPEAHVVTRKQVYNFWISLTQGEWHRDVDDFKSAQLLVEPSMTAMNYFKKFDRAKIDATFGTNKHGFELYCVLAEYDLVSLPLSYLLLDTRGIQENGKRSSRLTTWLMEFRNAGLSRNGFKDFAGMNRLCLFTLICFRNPKQLFPNRSHSGKPRVWKK
ncbi:hypothetical protein V1509DRAFT_609236 [Lipomyces kononenkoae]